MDFNMMYLHSLHNLREDMLYRMEGEELPEYKEELKDYISELQDKVQWHADRMLEDIRTKETTDYIGYRHTKDTDTELQTFLSYSRKVYRN